MAGVCATKGSTTLPVTSRNRRSTDPDQPPHLVGPVADHRRRRATPQPQGPLLADHGQRAVDGAL
jgi:hypothetical protein